MDEIRIDIGEKQPVDLTTGDLKRVPTLPDLDFQHASSTADGRIIGYSANTRAALWKFSK